MPKRIALFQDTMIAKLEINATRLSTLMINNDDDVRLVPSLTGVPHTLRAVSVGYKTPYEAEALRS